MDNPFAILSQRLENIEEFMSAMQSFFKAESIDHSLQQSNSPDEPLLSDVEIALHIGCAKSTVLKHARNGVLPHYRAGRLYRFKISEVDLALSSLTPIRRNKKGVKANG